MCAQHLIAILIYSRVIYQSSHALTDGTIITIMETLTYQSVGIAPERAGILHNQWKKIASLLKI